MEKTLRELVSDLPTESLDLFVMHYEAGEVGGFLGAGNPLREVPDLPCRCPRAALGYEHDHEYHRGRHAGHPAYIIESMAQEEGECATATATDLTAALYTEAVLALAERDGAGLPEPEPATAGR